MNDEKVFGSNCRVENFNQLDENWNPEEFKAKKMKPEKRQVDE
jgi:hypothetical protein